METTFCFPFPFNPNDVFRRYWVARMDDAKVTNTYLIDYQLGHLIPSETYYEGMFTDEKIVEAIKQADEHLRILT
jgi:hypothetical protein